MTPRKPHKRPSYSARPIAISDETSRDAIGLDGPAFRRFLVAYEIPHVKVGRRVVALATAITEALDRLANDVPAVESGFRANDQPEDVDAVLAVIGRRSAAGRGGK